MRRSRAGPDGSGRPRGGGPNGSRQDLAHTRGAVRAAPRSLLDGTALESRSGEAAPCSPAHRVTAPSNAKNWHGPYLDKIPADPWGQPYIYYYPGKHSANSYDLLSVGPDGKEGTDDDVVSWAK